MAEQALTTCLVWSLGMVVRRLDLGKGQAEGQWSVVCLVPGADGSPSSFWLYEARGPIHRSLCSVPWHRWRQSSGLHWESDL